jgi:hypothetical protein
MHPRAARNVFAALILACALALSGPLAAQERTLTFQVVAHTTESHDLIVPEQPEHRIGIVSFRGLAIFPDGQIANHWYSGVFDFIKGSGAISGYALWVFKDGAKLSAAYSGEAKAASGGGITFTARYGNVSGTGQFKDVSGEGSFEGQRIDYFKQGGDTYFRGSLKLKSGTK